MKMRRLFFGVLLSLVRYECKSFDIYILLLLIYYIT